jgi:hypothetical protein
VTLKVPVRTSIISSVAVLGFCFGASRAECQSTSAPTRPVYGGAQTRNQPADGLGLSVQAYEAYDDDVLAGTTGTGTPTPRSSLTAQSGFYSGLAAGLLYGHSGTNSSFRSWANTAVAYYPDQSNVTAIYHQLGLAFAAPLGDRVRIDANSFADYSPRYSLRLIPVLQAVESQGGLSLQDETPAPTPDFDYTVVQRDSYRYGGNVGVNVSITGRSSLGLAYGHAQTSSSDGLFDMQVRSARASFGYKMTRNASLTAGYSRYEGLYDRSNARNSVAETVNIGVNYHKPLSVTRRTFLQFATGTAVAENLDGDRSLRATGSAVLSHQIGRSWSARADYHRGVGYLEGFNEPVFSDTAGAGVGGLISRRVEFSSDARYFRGSTSPSSATRPFDTYSAWVRVRTGLTRGLAAYAEYFFYHYEFADAATRPTGVASKYSRQGVRVGISLWVPLVGRR